VVQAGALATTAAFAGGALLTQISAELTTWYRWNWIRTGLALAGTVLTCAALVANGRHTITATT
jgi:uncharacterized membrane protein